MLANNLAANAKINFLHSWLSLNCYNGCDTTLSPGVCVRVCAAGLACMWCVHMPKYIYSVYAKYSIVKRQVYSG